MAISKGNILIIDDDIDVLETARMFLKQYFTKTEICSDPSDLMSRVSKIPYDVIVLDMNFRKGRNDGEEGFYWLQRILEYDPDAVVIFITAYGEIDLAVKAIKLGATDFILKPWKNQKLLGTIMAGWKLRKSKKEVQKLQEATMHIQESIRNEFSGMVGTSPAMTRVFDLISKVSDTDANIIIHGENGTGKELVARALHTNSSRRKLPFITVDLGAVTETLFESELFGHVKGAFTDARNDRIGSFEMASGGTLFLDEIGNISLKAQAKLLTVLENRTVRKVGSGTDIDIDIRVVSATNRNLAEMVQEGSFRQDLLYRLNTVEIQIPPLRSRKEDIPVLAKHFYSIYNKKYRKGDAIPNPRELEKLNNHTWPGNVRELQHAIERFVILGVKQLEGINTIASSAKSLSSSPKTLDQMEKEFILQSLEENNGNVSRTAKILGLTRTAMYRRMKKYGI